MRAEKEMPRDQEMSLKKGKSSNGARSLCCSESKKTSTKRWESGDEKKGWGRNLTTTVDYYSKGCVFRKPAASPEAGGANPNNEQEKDKSKNRERLGK